MEDTYGEGGTAARRKEAAMAKRQQGQGTEVQETGSQGLNQENEGQEADALDATGQEPGAENSLPHIAQVSEEDIDAYYGGAVLIGDSGMLGFRNYSMNRAGQDPVFGFRQFFRTQRFLAGHIQKRASHLPGEATACLGIRRANAAGAGVLVFWLKRYEYGKFRGDLFFIRPGDCQHQSYLPGCGNPHYEHDLHLEGERERAAEQ